MTTEDKFRKILKRAEQNGFKIDKKVFLNHEDAPPIMGLLLNPSFIGTTFSINPLWGEKEARSMIKESIEADDIIDYFYDRLPQENPAFWDDTLETVINDK